MLSLKGKKVLLLVIAHFGHILTAMGQACNIGDSVIVCKDAIRTGTSFNMDFHIAKQYTSCSCSVVSTQKNILFIVPKIRTGDNCGMVIRVINNQTSGQIFFTCTSNGGTSTVLLANVSHSIEISKADEQNSSDSNYCLQISTNQNITFTLSCAESRADTNSSQATSTPESTTKGSSTSSYMSTTSMEVSYSTTNPSVSTAFTSNTNVTATETTPNTEVYEDNTEKSELDITIVAGAAGGGGALLVIVCIMVIVCYRRSRKEQNDEHGEGDQKHDHKQLDDNDASIPVDDNYDLTDNVLYNSVFIPDQEVSEIPKNKNNNKNTGYEDDDVVRTNRQNLSHIYSTPVVSVQPEGTDKGYKSAREDKEITTDSKNDESSIPIYAVSNKKKKINENENCEIPVYAMPMKKKNTNSREIPSAKSKPVVAKKPSKQSERRVNDDDLCYADLELSDSVRDETRSSLNNSNESDVQYADVRI